MERLINYSASHAFPIQVGTPSGERYEVICVATAQDGMGLPVYLDKDRCAYVASMSSNIVVERAEQYDQIDSTLPLARRSDRLRSTV